MGNVREATLTLKVDASAAKAGLNDFTRGLSATSLAVSLAEATVGKLIRSLGGLYAAYRGYEFVKQSVRDFAEFERQMAKVSTVLDQQTMSLLPGYTTAIRSMSVTMGESTDSLSDGLYEILQAMIAPEKALGVLEASAKAAAAGMTSTKVSVDAVTTVLNSYGLSADKASKVTSDLYEAALVGKMTFGDIAGEIGKVASTAAQAGISLEEMLAAMATLTRAGLRPDIAATSIRTIISQFLTPDDRALQAAKSLDLQMNSTTLHTMGLLGVIERLKNASPEVVAAIVNEARGLTGFNAALQNAQGLTRDFNYILRENGQDLIAYEKMMATPAKQFERFEQAIISIKRSLGAVLAPSLADAAAKIADWVGTNQERLTIMSQIVENEMGRIKDILFSFGKYLQTDFRGATQLGWDLFLQVMETAAKAAIDLATRAGKGIVAALKEEILGMGMEQAKAEAMRRYEAPKSYYTPSKQTWEALGGHGEPDTIPIGGGQVKWVEQQERGLFHLTKPPLVKQPVDQAAYDKIIETVLAERAAEQDKAIMAGFDQKWAALKAQLDTKVNALMAAPGNAAFGQFSNDVAQINAERNQRGAELQQRLQQYDYQQALGQWNQIVAWTGKQVDWIKSLDQTYIGGKEQPGTPNAPEPTYATGHKSGSGEDDRAQTATDDLIRKLELERNMLAQTDEERAKTIALEQLRQDIFNQTKDQELKTIDDLKRKYGEYAEAVEKAVAKLEQARRLTQMAKDIGNAFGTAFEDVVLGAKSAREAVNALMMDVARAVLHNMVTQPIVNSITSSLSTAFLGAAKAHGGWQVGAGGASTVRLPAAMFWTAPRLHDGLASDEYPAVLQRGESVVTPRQMAALTSPPSVSINITNNSSAPVTANVSDMKLDLRRMVVGIVLEDKQVNGPITRSLGR